MSTTTIEAIDTRTEAEQRVGRFVPCDTCRHRSYYFAVVLGTELSYCGHHANKYEVKLLQAAKGRVVDLRYTIDGS